MAIISTEAIVTDAAPLRQEARFAPCGDFAFRLRRNRLGFAGHLAKDDLYRKKYGNHLN